MTATNDRGQMSATAAVTLVVGLTIFGVLAAVMLPVAIDQLEGSTTEVVVQDEGVEYEINSALNSTATATTIGSPDTATVELNDTRTSGTTSNDIDNGSTANYSLEGGTVTVGVEDVDDSPTPNTTTLNYSYSNDYSYGSGASSLWGLLGLAIVLSALLFVVSVALKYADM